jgi:3-oxoacyl-[acyl-carrier protein] reductase
MTSQTDQSYRRLDGRVAIVTGGAHGIGFALARRLAHEGAHVVVADVDGEEGERAAREIRGEGLLCAATKTDVRQEESLRELADRTLAIADRIDILVNNAALFSTIRMSRLPFDKVPVDEWDDLLDVNLKGAWLACRAVVPSMKALGYGKIINIGSASAFKGSVNRIHYVASKAGMLGFTKSLARELGPHGILVNCVAPGSTLSEVNPDAETLELRRGALSGRAIQRVERPSDVAGVVAFFASPDSDFVTGQTLVVDGGSYMQ